MNIALEHFPIHSHALSYSYLHSHSYLDRLAALIHADVGYCTDYHNSSWNYNYLIASVIVPEIAVFADAPYTRVKLASDDCNFEVDFAFVVDPDWILSDNKMSAIFHIFMAIATMPIVFQLSHNGIVSYKE